MKKLSILFILFFAFILTTNTAEAYYSPLPPGITCKSPSAFTYPGYYIYCKTGVQEVRQSPPSSINTSYYYVPYLDEYRIDYSKINASSYELNFESRSGQKHSKTYTFSPTGIHYLTCNGDYTLRFFNSSGGLITETSVATTSQIQNPTCESYPDSGEKNELNAQSSESSSGIGHDLSWDAKPGASIYEVWVGGQKVDETPGTTSYVPGDGSVSIVAKDANGNIIAEDDMLVPITSDPAIDWGDGGCDACQKIRDMLACPDWDRYMGEWEDTIRRALPPPPDWPAISEIFAETIIRHLDSYLGDVPPPPTVAELQPIKPTMPNLDINIDGIQDLVPMIPSEYDNAPIPFDLSQAPVIEIIDESEPFIFFEPLHNMDTSGVGVKVLPGDSANHSDGIETPFIAPEYDPIPKPNKINEAPRVDMPKPSPGGGGGSVPNPTYSDMPIPDVPTNF